MDLTLFLKEKSKNQISSKPVTFDLSQTSDQEKLSELVEKNLVLEVNDDYREQLKEYFAILNPPLVYQPDFEKHFNNYLYNLEKVKPLWQQGRYVYFPWIFTLVHILEDEAFQVVRTARNQNLITAEEQKNFYEGVVGIAGLSVGNSIALAIVLQGGARHIKLADFDRLALTNLNRIRSGIDHLGLNKVEITARQIYLLNPYAEIELFPEGLTEDNINDFFEGTHKLDVFIDEIDQLAIECLTREYAKRLKIPVVRGMDNGDNSTVDIERYDLDDQIPFFHNRMGSVSFDELSKLDKFGVGRKIVQYVGVENVSQKIKESLGELGKTLVSWPQLGGAALLNGSAIAYCVRKILNNQPLENNRAHISLDEKLAPNYEEFFGYCESFDAWYYDRKPSAN